MIKILQLGPLLPEDGGLWLDTSSTNGDVSKRTTEHLLHKCCNLSHCHHFLSCDDGNTREKEVFYKLCTAV